MGLVIGTGGIHIGTSGGGASPVKRFDAEAEYIKRKAGGSDNIGTGKAKISTLKGKSLVWNQRISTFLYNSNYVTESTTGNKHVFTLTQNGGANRWLYLSASPLRETVGHKYLLKCNVVTTGIQENNHPDARYFFNNEWKSMSWDASTGKYSPIFLTCTAVSNHTNLSFGFIGGLTGDTATVYDDYTYQMFDLTLMFGAGNEPSTVEEFEAMYPLPYYEYNAGEIINNEAEAIETVGFNQWDEEWEVGGINAQGQNTTSTDRIRSKNYIPVFPSTVYYFKTKDNVYQGDVFFCDENKNFISGAWSRGNNTFETPANCYFIRIAPGPAYGDTYNNDICINLSDAARNGQYEPYEKHTLQLGLDAFDVKDSEDNVITVNGLKSAGSVYDEIDLARGKYIKRVGAVDMGTLTWASNTLRFYANIPGSAGYNGKLDIPQNIICELYKVAASIYDFNDSDKVVTIYDDGKVTVKDSAYSSSADFKTAMSGVMLYYELAEPVEYDLVTPIGNSYKVISGGTEERLPRDTASSVMAPIKYSVKYVQPKE